MLRVWKNVRHFVVVKIFAVHLLFGKTSSKGYHREYGVVSKFPDTLDMPFVDKQFICL